MDAQNTSNNICNNMTTQELMEDLKTLIIGEIDPIALKIVDNFSGKTFNKEDILNTFVGHPLIETKENTKTIIDNLIPEDKKIISLFPGSRKSETLILLPILISFIQLMNNQHKDYFFYFHATEENKNSILDIVKQNNIQNIDVVSEENIKSDVLSKSIFAVSKSGTVSLQI